jgi:NAD(P)H-hydrate epimerase
VVDADALNALAEQADAIAKPAHPRVLTPHPGEFARLSGLTSAEVQRDRQRLAVAFAARQQVVLVLKGHETVVSDGRRLYVNPTGNPGMATGGTGDVLTGLVAALLGQRMQPFEAAQLAVYLHGLAGDLAAAELGQTALMASDLLEWLPRAVKTVEQIPNEL